MDFNQLLARMQELDGVKAEAPVVDQNTSECGMNEMPPMMAPNMPPAEPKEKASMSININAQGDAIDDVMNLIKKMAGNDKPEIGDMPSISIMSPGMDGPMDGPEGPPMPKPINKLLPDFDGDNDDMPGGEKDLPKDHDKDHVMIKSLDKDGDMDHDMDDHDMEKDDEEEKKDKDEAYANEPDEEYKDIDYITQKTAGGMNRRKGTHPKVAGGDNPMQKVGEAELRNSIKEQLLKALEEHKGA